MIDFQQLFEHAPAPYMVLDRELRYVAANRAYLEVTASTLDGLLGRPLLDVFPDDPHDPGRQGADMLRGSLARVLATGEPDTLALIPYKVPRHTPEGTVLQDRYWSATHTPLLDHHGRVAWILQHTEDVTEVQALRQAASTRASGSAAAAGFENVESRVLDRARRVQQENLTLERERGHLRQLFEQAPGFVCTVRGPDHVFDIANAAYRELIGRQDIIGLSLKQVLPEALEQGFVRLLDEVLATGRPYIGRAVRVVIERGGGPREFFLDFIYQPIQDSDGDIAGVFVLGHDVTDRVLAHQHLLDQQEHLEELVQARTHDLAETQAALHQAQKMEAVGRLTGGVAHDFNNLLQVIAGNLQLLESTLGEDPVARRRVRNAGLAVERGARLASQLLAFARRQPLKPQVLEVERLLGQLGDMLRRVLGGAITQRITAEPGLWRVSADLAQMENALLNLAINARDAMNGEGSLVLDARNVKVDAWSTGAHDTLPPGEYVRVAVTDSGCGMSAEVRSQAFEPFFTTKREGQGSGLGLSMVYGFVKQSGGHVVIDSEVAAGTTVSVYLPRTAAPASSDRATAGTPAVGGSETILVVEDDEQVRATVVELLESLGYTVLTAADGGEALVILDSEATTDLLFTDVVMPGPVSGAALAGEARRRRPDMAVLHTSGYPREGIMQDGRVGDGVSLLSKPYNREDLARAVRHLLARRERG